jgi:hypothetical protein
MPQSKASSGYYAGADADYDPAEEYSPVIPNPTSTNGRYINSGTEDEYFSTYDQSNKNQ